MSVIYSNSNDLSFVVTMCDHDVHSKTAMISSLEIR